MTDVKKEEGQAVIGNSSIEVKDDSSQNNGLFGGNQSTPFDQTDINNNPAIFQTLNSLEIVLKKTVFEKSDFETLQSARQLLPDSEINRLRPNISMSLLDNLSKKSDEYARTQKLENSNEVITKQQQEALEQNEALTLKKRQEDQEQNQASIKKLLSPKEIEYQRDFLKIITSNDLNKDSQTREKESNGVNNGQTIL
jgi:hypothetical protein